MIEHSFMGDWRHVALPLVMTAIVAAIGATIAFSRFS
jgi:hypothetical protein